MRIGVLGFCDPKGSQPSRLGETLNLSGPACFCPSDRFFRFIRGGFMRMMAATRGDGAAFPHIIIEPLGEVCFDWSLACGEWSGLRMRHRFSVADAADMVALSYFVPLADLASYFGAMYLFTADRVQ